MKKRKVIHWNPEEQTSGLAQRRKARSRKFMFAALKKTVVLFVFLAVCFSAWKIYQIYLKPYHEKAVNIATEAAGLQEEKAVDPHRFISEKKVILYRAEVYGAVDDITKLSVDHPTFNQVLLRIRRAFEDGDRLLSSRRFGQAMDRFDATMNLIADYRKLVDAKEESNESYEKFLSLIEKHERIRQIAPYDYERALAKGNEARRLWEAGKFEYSALSFTEAIALLSSLEERLTEYIAERELNGKQALATGDSEMAKTSFQEILEVHSGYEEAIRGLQRAETIEEVFEMLEMAKELEDSGDLEEALAEYEAAFEIDEFSLKAQQGANRLKDAIAKKRFKDLFEAANQAVESKDWNEAINNYEAIIEEFPDRLDIEDKLADARENKWEATLQDALDRALTHETNREWDDARNAYLEVLEMEKNHFDATEGLIRTGKTIRAIVRYETLMKQTLEFSNRGEFQQAIELYNEAMDSKPLYLELTPEYKEMKKLLSAQSRAVPVRLVSDGRTYVTVSAYTILGKFSSRTEKFLPGNYQLRGRRKGFRDVVVNIRVRGGEPTQVVKIECNVKLGN